MNKIIPTTLTIILIFSSIIILAQGNPPGGPGGAPCWPPPCVPVDGGISILVAIGAFFGGKSFYDFLKTKH